jgi:hypothetical protein
MKVAIMQPYVFPYIGYFQLVHAADVFVFYDDVNFIKQGWINRNRILVNREPYLFTIPLEKISSFKEIREVKIHTRNYGTWKDKFIKTMNQSYGNAPFYKTSSQLIHSILASGTDSISDLAEWSVKEIYTYLGYDKKFMKSSRDFVDTKGLDKADRLIEICKRCGADHYINPSGGTDLYHKDYFNDREVQLSFIKSAGSIKYKQRELDFIPWLSIIDVLMYNSKERVREFLNLYTLE